MRKRVLLIDDSMAIHKIVELTLDHGNFELFSAYTADDGLKLAQEHDPHIVMVDNKLCPEPAVLQAIASGPSHPGIILLFGAYEKFPEAGISNLNVQDYLIKPFNANALNRALTSLADSSEESGAASPQTDTEEMPVQEKSTTEEPLQEIIAEQTAPPAQEVQTGSDTVSADIPSVPEEPQDPLGVIEQDIEFEILERHIDTADGLSFTRDGTPAAAEAPDSGVNITEAGISAADDTEDQKGPMGISSKPTDTAKLPAVDSGVPAEPIPMPPRAKDAHLLEEHEPIAMGYGGEAADKPEDITPSAGNTEEEPQSTAADISDKYESAPATADITQSEPVTDTGTESTDKLPEELLSAASDPKSDGVASDRVNDDMLDSLYNLLTESGAQDEILTDRDMPDSFADTAGVDEFREEIAERQELMEMFDELDSEIEYLADSFEHETGGEDEIPSGFRKIAELAGAGETKPVPVKNDTGQSFIRAGKLTIDLSKEELADLLMRSVNTEDVQNMIKEAMRLSLEQTMEKVVREEIKQLKGEE